MGKKDLIKKIPLIYLLYILIFGALIFLIRIPSKNEKVCIEEFKSEDIGIDKIALIEDRYESFLVRMDLLSKANESIDIAYYTLHDGKTTRLFLAEIYQAADRGVKVRFLLDGIFHNLDKEIKDTIYAFETHPNIELLYYEPFTLRKPSTWNNRLHDKFIIVDDEIFLLGGRNIGDKYFLEDYEHRKQVKDRDVLVLTEDKMGETSVKDLKNYFEELWNSDYSHPPVKRIKEKQILKGEKFGENLLKKLEKEKKKKDSIIKEIDYKSRLVETNKVSIVNNSINRLNKEPVVLSKLMGLAYQSEKIYAQSPYIIFTRGMKKNIDLDKLAKKDISLYTNSLLASPNPFASGGYYRNRKKLVDSGYKLYEYQGPDSIHGKSYIFDDKIAAVGSFNLDHRSAYLSTETMVIVDSEAFSKVLLGEIGKIEENSFRVGKDYNYITDEEVLEPNILKKALVRVLSVLTYLFDFML